jgi:hypothetical protein
LAVIIGQIERIGLPTLRSALRGHFVDLDRRRGARLDSWFIAPRFLRSLP